MNKENTTQKLVETLKEVSLTKKQYKVSDEVKAQGKNCKIVEILDTDRFHLKNLDEPFDSFVVLGSEIEN